MSTHKSPVRRAAMVILASVLLLGCGGENPESMLASAKDYLSKGDNKAASIQLKNVLQKDPKQAEARFLLGKTLLNSGDATAAEVELNKARELNFSSDQVTPLLAHAQLLLGQNKKIVDELAKIPMSTPESKADLQSSVGLAYLMLGRVDAAQAAYDAALAAVPDYGPALIGQARIKAGKRDLAGALKLIDSALEKSPKLYEAWQLRGDILRAQGDAKQAAEAYRQALAIKPDLLAAHSALIARMLETDEIDAAAKQLEAMKKVAPKHPLTGYLNAQILYRQKDFKAAQAAIQQYLKVLPDNTLGLQLAGVIEYELKAYTLAESYLQKALPKTPELGLTRRTLIASYLRSGKPAKALSTLQPVIDKIDDNSNMLALAGEVYMQNGDVDRAAKYFSKSAALDPANTAKRTSVALTNLAKGDSETAFRELEQISSVDSGIKADLALIAAYLNRRQYDQALDAIATLEKKQPDNPLPFNLRGSALLGKGDAAGARRSFEQALAKSPLYFPAAASLASLDLIDKKPDAAKKRFDDILAKDPKNVQALLALAELRAKTGGKTDEVAPLIKQAIAANPTEAGPRIALVELYLGAKDAKSALAAASDALGVLPDRPEIVETAGRAQQAAGDNNQALASYGKLVALLPNSPRPLLRMAEAQVAAKDKAAAMQSLNKALAMTPDLIEAQRGIAMLHLDAGRTAEALAVCRQIQKQRPREAVGYVLEGDIHTLKKSWPEAIAVYRTGLKQSGVADLAIKLHAALAANGNAAEAERFADSYLKEHAKEQQFRLYLAEAANLRQDYALAVKHYRVLLDAQPNNPALLNNLAWTLSRTKDPKAIEYAEKAYQLAPNQPAIMDTLSELLLEKGDTARALQLAQQASALTPQNAFIQLNLAKALLKSGKKEEAKKELDELAKQGDKFSAHAEVSKLRQSL